ncbi:MAG: hypothetical protein DRP75_04210, partial [Candidatus Omnitrophota bacterium]
PALASLIAEEALELIARQRAQNKNLLWTEELAEEVHRFAQHFFRHRFLPYYIDQMLQRFRLWSKKVFITELDFKYLLKLRLSLLQSEALKVLHIPSRGSLSHPLIRLKKYGFIKIEKNKAYLTPKGKEFLRCLEEDRLNLSILWKMGISRWVEKYKASLREDTAFSTLEEFLNQEEAIEKGIRGLVQKKKGLSKQKMRIFCLYSQGLGVMDIYRALKIKRHQKVSDYLRKLERRGWLKRGENHVYQLTDKGNSLLRKIKEQKDLNEEEIEVFSGEKEKVLRSKVERAERKIKSVLKNEGAFAFAKNLLDKIKEKGFVYEETLKRDRAKILYLLQDFALLRMERVKMRREEFQHWFRFLDKQRQKNVLESFWFLYDPQMSYKEVKEIIEQKFKDYKKQVWTELNKRPFIILHKYSFANIALVILPLIFLQIFILLFLPVFSEPLSPVLFPAVILLSSVKNKDRADEHLLDTLILQAREGGDREREKAILKLGKIGSREAIKELVALLKDERRDVRELSVRALGETRSKEAIKPLIDILLDDQEQIGVQKIVKEALVKIGEPAVPVLIEILGNKDRIVRHFAASALREIRTPLASFYAHLFYDAFFSTRYRYSSESISLLHKALEHPAPEVRGTAIRVLGEIGAEESIEPLIRRLVKEEDREIRARIIEALTQIGPNATVTPSLIRMLSLEKRLDMRLCLIKALGNVGDKRAFKILIKIASDKQEDETVRQSAIESLAKLKKRGVISSLSREAISSLIRILDEQGVNENLYLSLLITLGKLGLNVGYMNEKGEIDLPPGIEKQEIERIQRLISDIRKESEGDEEYWKKIKDFCPSYYGVELSEAAYEILPVIYVKPKYIEGKIVPGTGIFYTEVSDDWPPQEFHLKTKEGVKTIKMSEEDYVPMFGYRTSGRGFVVLFQNNKLIYCKGETRRRLKVYKAQGRERVMPEGMQNYNLALREKALIELFGNLQAEVRELDSFYFRKDDPAYPLIQKETEGRLAQLQIYNERGVNFSFYRWTAPGELQMRRVSPAVWKALGFKSEIEFTKFRIKSLFQNLGKAHLLHLYIIGLDGENLSLLGEFVDLEFAEVRESIVELAKNASNALQFLVLRHGQEILAEQTRNLEKYLIARSLPDILRTQLPFLSPSQIEEISKLAILAYLPPLKDYNLDPLHRYTLEKLIGEVPRGDWDRERVYRQKIYSFPVEGEKEDIKISPNSLANIVAHHLVKPGDRVPETRSEYICSTALGIALNFEKIRRDLDVVKDPNPWAKYRKVLEEVYGKPITERLPILSSQDRKEIKKERKEENPDTLYYSLFFPFSFQSFHYLAPHLFLWFKKLGGIISSLLMHLTLLSISYYPTSNLFFSGFPFFPFLPIRGVLEEKKMRRLRRLLQALERVNERSSISSIERKLKKINHPLAEFYSHLLSGEVDKLALSQNLPLLSRLLKSHPLPRIRFFSAKALGLIDREEAIPALLEALKDEDAGVREISADALKEMLKNREKIERALIEALEYGDERMSYSAIQILGDIKSKKAVEPLLRMLESEDANIRRAAVRALGKIRAREEKVVFALAESLQDENEAVVEYALTALSKIDPQAQIYIRFFPSDRIPVLYSLLVLDQRIEVSFAEDFLSSLTSEKLLNLYNLLPEEIKKKIKKEEGGVRIAAANFAAVKNALRGAEEKLIFEAERMRERWEWEEENLRENCVGKRFMEEVIFLDKEGRIASFPQRRLCKRNEYFFAGLPFSPQTIDNLLRKGVKFIKGKIFL